jgi:predicted HTH domain antitoxin
MTKITLEVPGNLEMSQFEVTMMLAAKLYEEGKLSSGQAAEMAGLSKRAFIELLGKYGVSVFGYDFDELENDLNNA